MKPIIFNTEMVRAILDNCKTATRRVIKSQPVHNGSFWELGGAGWSDNISTVRPVPCHSLYNRMTYKPDDILYVRETFWKHVDGCYTYKADDNLSEFKNWKPSIHMPREAARIFLRVTDVRVERLQDITPAQCVAEGADDGTALAEIGGEFVRGMFNDLWNSTIKLADRALYGWEANPWVWVIEFERISKAEALSDVT